jgi:hypothetical protein
MAYKPIREIHEVGRNGNKVLNKRIGTVLLNKVNKQ